MATKETTKEKTTVLFPEGTLINASLFEKDTYTDPEGRPGTPSYKIEVAYDKKDLEVEGGVFDQYLAFIDKTFGANPERVMDIDGGDVVTPFLDGDKLAKKRQKAGKKGDAYEGKIVVRSSTIFNKHGQDAPGGIQVWDPQVQEIGPANQGDIYPGCKVRVATSLNVWVKKGSGNEDDRDAIKSYLDGVQKTDDGERLVTGKDTSVLFKSRDGGAAANTSRRSRKG